MAKHIRTFFASAEEARRAREYMLLNGFPEATSTGRQLDMAADEENWAAAFEMLNGLGAAFEQSDEFHDALAAVYQLGPDDPQAGEAAELPIVDPYALIDPNLGFGDFEIIRPYVLHEYHHLTEKNQD